MKWGEGCETCTALGPYPFFVVLGRRLGESCRILLTEDTANRSFQGFVWSFLSFPSHQFWEITVNFPCWQMSEQEQGTSVSHHTDFTQRQIQANKVGYIFFWFCSFLWAFAKIQTGNWITNISKFKTEGFSGGRKTLIGKMHERNLPTCFKIVCLYNLKSSGKWQKPPAF